MTARKRRTSSGESDAHVFTARAGAERLFERAPELLDQAFVGSSHARGRTRRAGPVVCSSWAADVAAGAGAKQALQTWSAQSVSWPATRGSSRTGSLHSWTTRSGAGAPSRRALLRARVLRKRSEPPVSRFVCKRADRRARGRCHTQRVQAARSTPSHNVRFRPWLGSKCELVDSGKSQNRRSSALKSTLDPRTITGDGPTPNEDSTAMCPCASRANQSNSI